jgi:hypothetical protein
MKSIASLSTVGMNRAAIWPPIPVVWAVACPFEYWLDSWDSNRKNCLHDKDPCGSKPNFSSVSLNWGDGHKHTPGDQPVSL